MIWETTAWHEEAHRWIKAVLERERLGLSAAIEQIHLREWSTVLRVPTNRGDYFFKASAPVFEANLTATLSQLQPQRVPEVIAFAGERGWMLMADSGRLLRECFNAEVGIERWKPLLADYAQLQIELAGHVEILLAAGTPDRRLELLPALYEWLLADEAGLMIGQEDGLSSAEFTTLQTLIPHVQSLCEQLAAFPIPHSLHHNDLHDGNIFLRDNRPIFFDWGDSSIAHPFFSLRTVFVSIESRFDLAEDDPYFDVLMDVYLQVWRGFDSIHNLRIAFTLARQLWSLSSAIKYKSFLDISPTFRAEYGFAVPALLQEFLDIYHAHRHPV